MADIIKPGDGQEVLKMKGDIDQLAKAVMQQNQTLQTIIFIIDYLVEKLEIDQEDLKQYLDQRFKEYFEKIKQNLAESNIIVPNG